MVTGAFLNILKPTGMTSHDVVDCVRRWWVSQRPVGLPPASGKPKVGHLGTLDPDAAGVLPLALGTATKLIPYIPAAHKTYVGEVTFGLVSDTLDLDGEVSEGGTPPEDLIAALERVLPRYQGTILQVPPRVSALRRDGKRGYDRARGGEDFEFEAREAHYSEVQLLGRQGPRVRLRVGCGPGTYIRALARDLGQDLGCGAILSSLVRIQNGPFQVASAVTLEELKDLNWPLLPWHFPFPQRQVERLETFTDPLLDGAYVLVEPSLRAALVNFRKGQPPQAILLDRLSLSRP